MDGFKMAVSMIEYQIKISKEKLGNLYIDKQLTIHQTADELGLNPKTVSRYLKLYNLKRTRSEAKKVYYSKHIIWNKGISKVNPNLEPSNDLSYILGVLKGDGTVTDERQFRIYLDQVEPEFAVSFEKALRNIALNTITYILKDRNQYRTQTQSLIFFNWYKSLSLDDIIKVISKKRNFIIAFIKGFYESEGLSCINKNKKGWIRWRLMIFNTDFQLLSEVQKFLKILGFNFRLGVQRKKGMISIVKGYFCISKKPLYYLESANKEQNYDFIKIISPCIKNKIAIPKNVILIQERLKWIIDYENKRFKTVKELCNFYKISKKKFYRWLKRYKKNSITGLANLNYIQKV